MKKLLLIISTFICLSFISYAQEEEKEEGKQEPNREGVVLEADSSWLKGPQTSWYITQDDWYKIHFEEHMMDSSYTHLHRYDVHGMNGYRYQTLGNNASPLRSYWESPTGDLGQSVGITGYDLYAQDIDTWEYYNSYVPVTDFNGVVGQDNRGKIGGKISNNIDPYWSIGMLFQRYSEPYIVGRDKISNSYNAQAHTGFGLNTRYESKDNKYKLLASYYQYFHEGPESGGIQVRESLNDETSLDDLFRLGRGQLSNYFSEGASSFKWKYNYHFYHQYALVDTAKLQVFHEFTRDQYRYQFSNTQSTLSANKAYYDYYNDYSVENLRLLPDSTLNNPQAQLPLETNYDYGSGTGERPYVSIEEQYLDNKVGVKSRLGPTFWSGFARYRYYKAQQISGNSFVSIPVDNQLFLGGDVEFLLPKKLGAVTGHAEFETLNAEVYNIDAKINSKYLKGGFTVERTLAPIMTQYFTSVFMSWNEKKDPISKQQISIAPQIPLGKYGHLEIFGELNNISDYIYYDKFARPQQHDESIAYSRYGSRFKLTFGSIQQIAEVIYTQNTHQDVMPTPDLFMTYELAYFKEFRQGMISLYTGFDTRFISAYYGMAYNPVTQQYHLQNAYKTEGYLNVDFFVNFKMRRAMAFIRISDILNAVDQSSGYWATPGFMGAGFGISYGVRWLMFE